MTDTEIALLQALRVEVAALRATVERGDHSINLLIEQVRCAASSTRCEATRTPWRVCAKPSWTL
jgi:hypothetical protein